VEHVVIFLSFAYGTPKEVPDITIIDTCRNFLPISLNSYIATRMQDDKNGKDSVIVDKGIVSLVGAKVEGGREVCVSIYLIVAKVAASA
jgi:hypothetical protein